MIDLTPSGGRCSRRPTPPRPSWRSSPRRRTRSIASIRAACGLGDKLDEVRRRRRRHADRRPTSEASKAALSSCKLDNDNRGRREELRISRRRSATSDSSGTIFADVDGRTAITPARARRPRMYTSHVGGAPQERGRPGGARRRSWPRPPTDFSDYLAIVGAAARDVVKAETALKACGTGNATGGAATDQETGDGLGDKANGGKKTTMKADDGDGPRRGRSRRGRPADAADEPGQQGRHARRQGRRRQERHRRRRWSSAKAPARRRAPPPTTRRTTKSTPSPASACPATTRGMPAKAKSPTETGGVHPAKKFDGDGDGDDAMVSDDDSTNGAQSMLPAKAKSPTDWAASTWPRPQARSRCSSAS